MKLSRHIKIKRFLQYLMGSLLVVMAASLSPLGFEVHAEGAAGELAVAEMILMEESSVIADINFSIEPKASGGNVVAYDVIAPSDANVVTVAATVRFDVDSRWDDRNELWLAALVPEDDGVQGGVGLVWHVIPSLFGFFPSWSLALVDDAGTLGRYETQSLVASDDAYRVLSKDQPRPNHTYRVVLSYDRASHVVSVRVDDLTTARPVYAGSHTVRPQPERLMPSVGAFARCGSCSPAEEPPMYALGIFDVMIFDHYVPVDATFRLLVDGDRGLEPVVTSYLSQSDATAQETSIPSQKGAGAPLAGRLIFIAETADGVVPLADVTAADLSGGMAAAQYFPLDALPPGPVTFALSYVAEPGGARWAFAHRSFEVTPMEVFIEIETDHLVAPSWRGALKINSRGGTQPLEVSVDATVWTLQSGEWESRGRWELFHDAALTVTPEVTTVPLTPQFGELTRGEATLMRIDWHVNVAPSAVRTTMFDRQTTMVLFDPEAMREPSLLDYEFYGSIEAHVLDNYLARSITMSGVGKPDNEELLDDVRFILNTGAKFIGRATSAWGTPRSDEAHFHAAARLAEMVHAGDPDVILQAAIFEAVYEDVVRIPIPAWVFEAFGLPVEKRHFSYADMLFADGLFVDYWSSSPSASVPDMSRLETQMWFFYRAKRYIDAGFEAIHFGQVHLMDKNDPGHRHWKQLLDRIRAYAKVHARRGLLLADAHTHGVVIGDQLLFDFHSAPLRIAQVPGRPIEGRLVMGRLDTIYKRSLGGITPSGWHTPNAPYLAEFDNWGVSDRPGESAGEWWTWGYDEISWFAHLEEDERNEWLVYAWGWIRENDPTGWLKIPGKRSIEAPVDGLTTYRGNTRSAANPFGFGQEQTIKEIWGNP